MDSRLRFFFHDAVLSFSLLQNSTFEDVARALGAVRLQRYGSPVAIKVTPAVQSATFASSHAMVKPTDLAGDVEPVSCQGVVQFAAAPNPRPSVTRSPQERFARP